MNSVDFEVLLCNRLTITGEMVTELLAFTDLHPPPPPPFPPCVDVNRTSGADSGFVC